MFKKLNILFLISILVSTANCLYFKERQNLQFSNDCCSKKPSKIYISINNKKPSLDDKFENSFLTYLEHLLNKNNFSTITEFDQKNQIIEDDSIYINIPFLFIEDAKIITGGGRNYTTYIKAPSGSIGIQGRKAINTDPIYSMFININSEYKYDVTTKKYSIQNQNSLLLKFAVLYSSIINNLYIKPASIEGKYLELVSENIYEIKNENGKYVGYLKPKNGDANTNTERPFLHFDKKEDTQKDNHFQHFTGKDTRFLNSTSEVELIQFGNIILLKDPKIPRKNILNQNVEFYLDNYLLKIE